MANQAATKNVNRDGTPAVFGSDHSEGLLVSPLAETLGSQAWRIALYFDAAGERSVGVVGVARSSTCCPVTFECGKGGADSECMRRLGHLVSSPFPPIQTDAEFTIDALGPMDRLDK